jgi:hypothetical protein
MLKQPDSDVALPMQLVADFSFYDVVNSCSTYHGDRRSKIAKFSTNEVFIGYFSTQQDIYVYWHDIG